MKYLLVTALLGVGIFVGVCNAACMFVDPKENVNGGPPECVFEGKTHAYGSSWRRDDCLNCHCFDDGVISCCQAYRTPVAYNKERCNFVFDQKECVYKLIPNEDPNIQCDSYAMMG